MEQCKDCLRWTGRECEALAETIYNCWAKETDKAKYIKEQQDIIKYNGNNASSRMAKASIKRIRGVLDDMS